MQKLLIATHNPGKVKEFREMLGDVVPEIVSSIDFDLSEPEETGSTFAENALIKARAACEKTGLPSIGDDSGLCVEALGDAPGLYSSRWAKTEDGRTDFDMAMRRINGELGDSENRNARFVAVLALVYPDGRKVFFEDEVKGTISWPPAGNKGFGYDPIFIPDGHNITFAQMGEEKKNPLSHRGRAVERLKKYLSVHKHP